MLTPRSSHSKSLHVCAMREGMRKAGAKLLEPIMKVEVITPEEYTGGIIGDLTSRRGQVLGQDTRGNAIAIDAQVPLGEHVRLHQHVAFDVFWPCKLLRCSSATTSRFRRTSLTRSKRNTHKRGWRGIYPAPYPPNVGCKDCFCHPND